jgi:coproporphyrinogen III oxidase
LRDRICAAFEAIEDEIGDTHAAKIGVRPAGCFTRTAWTRPSPDGGDCGGGVMSVMKGRVFEKVGVNVSTVGGTFEGDFAKSIHGAGDDPRFFATGISLVAHMANPHVPAVHMNTRFLVTTKRWFGGGADLNPPLPIEQDTIDFHAALKAACDAHDPAHYPRFKKWADDYFYIPHRQVHRGVGGIFYDHLEGDFDANLAFTKDVGRAFLSIYPAIVRRRMATPFTDADIARRNAWRGRYAEFNLVYDRGTLFGLKTGGNIDAILMSLPPVATWD